MKCLSSSANCNFSLYSLFCFLNYNVYYTLAHLLFHKESDISKVVSVNRNSKCIINVISIVYLDLHISNLVLLLLLPILIW